MNILGQDAGLPKQSIAGLTDDLTWLPAVDPDHVDILNMFRRNAVPVQLNISGLSGTLSIADRACPLVEPVAIPLSVGPWAGKLVLPAGMLQPLLQRRGVVGNVTDLTPLQRSILLEHLLAGLLNELEAAIARPIRFDWLDQVAEFDVILPWVIQLEDFPRHAELHLSTGAARALGQFINKFPGDDPGALAPSIVFPIQLCAGTQSLTVSELKSLHPGDVILCGEPPGTDTFAILSDRFFAPTRTDGDNHVLDAAWKPLNQTQESLMKSQTKIDTATTPGDPDQFEDLPVQLVFEIGRCELPLSEIRKLGEGSIVPTAPGTANAVNILANGRLVGNGELVKIGAGIGVRVLRLSRHG